MDKQYIQLQEANCRNCMRCVRICPTKAMTYVDYQPVIKTEECILCGQCYLVCPHDAKRVFSDLAKVKRWLKDGEKVVVSLAPSFASVWPNLVGLKKNCFNSPVDKFFRYPEIGSLMITSQSLELENQFVPDILLVLL